MAVKNLTKPKAFQIEVRTLLTGSLNPGPHVGLEVGETYVTRHMCGEGFITASVKMTALWSDRSG